MTPATGQDKGRIFSRDFFLASFASFMVYANFYLLLTTLPLYITDMGAGKSEVGLIMAAFGFASFLSRPVAGTRADAWGRKVLMILGSLGMLTAPLLYNFATSVPVLVVLRLLHGVSLAFFATSVHALVADLVPPLRRGEGVGNFGIAISLAMAAAPPLGTVILEGSSFFALFSVSAATGLVATISSWIMREPRRPREASPRSTTAALLEPSAFFPALIIFLFCLTYGAVTPFVALFAMERDLGNPGLFFTVYSLVITALRSETGHLSDLHGRGKVIIPGLILCTLSLLLLSRSTTIPLFLASAFLYGLAYAAIHPSLLALVIDRVRPERRGAAMGTFSAAFDGGVAVGAVIWGFAAEWWGFAAMYMLVSLVPLVASLVFVLVGRKARPARYS